MLNARTLIRGVLGAAFGATLLFFVVHKVDTREVWTAARSASWAWIFIGMMLYAAALMVRAERWRRLIRPTLDIPYRAVAKAIVVGYAMNNLLPARLGEVVRADYISRRQGLARSAALGSIAIERLMDGVVVIAIFISGLVSISSVSRQAVNSLMIIGVLAVVGLGAVTLLILACIRWHAKLPERFAWLKSRVAIFARSISSLSTTDLSGLFVISLAIWFVEAHAIDCMMRAFGLTVGWVGLCLVVGAASLSTLLPSAPGYLGSLQMGFVLAFSGLGIPEPLGILSATATQIFLLGATTLAGLLILLTDQFSPITRSAQPTLDTDAASIRPILNQIDTAAT